MDSLGDRRSDRVRGVLLLEPFRSAFDRAAGGWEAFSDRVGRIPPRVHMRHTARLHRIPRARGRTSTNYSHCRSYLE